MLTTTHFSTLDVLFEYYNQSLFQNTLPECIVNLSRKSNTHGFFAPDRWMERVAKKNIHEISLNPDTMNRPDIEWHSTLVHEMVHLWQESFGNPSRRCYHNKEWATKMIEIGLHPSDTAEPGGKMVGQSVSHYILEDGNYARAFNSISQQQLDHLRLNCIPNFFPSLAITKPGEDGGDDDGEEEDGEKDKAKSKSGVKIKYSCSCGCNVWGKPDLNIICGECHTQFETI